MNHLKSLSFTAETWSDVQAAIDALMDRGVSIAAVQRRRTEPMHEEANPRVGPSGRREPAFAAFIRDPAGTLIELVSSDA